MKKYISKYQNTDCAVICRRTLTHKKTKPGGVWGGGAPPPPPHTTMIDDKHTSNPSRADGMDLHTTAT